MPDDLIHKIAGNSQSAATALHVRSALNPMLWLTGITSPTFIIIPKLLNYNELITTIFAGIGAIPMLVTCGGFIYFAIFKPEKLQSEDYQIRHESLQILQQKSGSAEIDGASITQIANPNAGQLHRKVSNEK